MKHATASETKCTLDDKAHPLGKVQSHFSRIIGSAMFPLPNGAEYKRPFSRESSHFSRVSPSPLLRKCTERVLSGQENGKTEVIRKDPLKEFFPQTNQVCANGMINFPHSVFPAFVHIERCYSLLNLSIRGCDDGIPPLPTAVPPKPPRWTKR